MNRTVIITLSVIGLCLAGWWLFRSHENSEMQWQGYAEADFIKVSPTQSGQLTRIAVNRGDSVTTGAPLFDQDDIADAAALRQAKQQLAQAEASLANLRSPAKPTEISQAKANLADAQAARDKIRNDLRRNERLVKTHAVSVQLVEQQRADMKSAEARVQSLSAALEQMQSAIGRENEIKVQNAAAEAAHAAMAVTQWRFDQRHVVSPVSGNVTDVLARAGETVAEGTPVVSLLPPANIFVRFFVPEKALSRIHHGDRVQLACDNCPNNLTATVSFISPQAEYTPPLIYSESNNAKLVYMIEARPTAPEAARLNPGQPIMVSLLPQPDKP
ncbi:MAG TPA: HlyD family efflux transporter periplasmic adaptor subunit [Rickettsiales bacterium]|nr:HlyD family efflux transporter periplasmic adaptor subunit [Rickettsiales bacterium]